MTPAAWLLAVQLARPFTTPAPVTPDLMRCLVIVRERAAMVARWSTARRAPTDSLWWCAPADPTKEVRL